MRDHDGIPCFSLPFVTNLNSASSIVTFYVHVENPAGTLAKVAALGGKTLMPPTPIPNVGTIGLFQDPEGHCIGIIKMLQPPA